MTTIRILIRALAMAALFAVATASGDEGSKHGLAAGRHHTCALSDNGAVKCWGYNGAGQLGLGDTKNRGDLTGEMGKSLPTVALGSGRTAVGLAAGDLHSCALLDNGTVKCWGFNDDGQLGLGDTNDRGTDPSEMGNILPAVALGTGRTAVGLVAGGRHTCALLDNGAVKCWGNNTYGQLGLGDANRRGDAPSTMGDALPAVAFGAGRTAVEFAAGYLHTCARLDNGAVKCWGNNAHGQLGLGNTSRRGGVSGEMGDALPAVALGTGRTAAALAAGGFHTCARLDNGTVKCWGNNADGQLGLGDTNRRGSAPSQMDNALPAVALGAGRTAVALATGGRHTCAQLDNGTVKCWGYNGTGQLGLGDARTRGIAASGMGDVLPAVALGAGRTAVALAAGDNHTCARLDNGAIKCWGLNIVGQLGLGDTTRRGDAVSGMGDALPAVALGGSRAAVAHAAGVIHANARSPNETGDTLLTVDLGLY